MSERRQPAAVEFIDLFCDACPDERMLWDGMMLASNPPQYRHACPRCGAIVTARRRFPSLVATAPGREWVI